MLWHSAMMLTLEAAGVFHSRMMKIASGQLTADEGQLMMTEKFGAAMQACSIMACGGDADRVIRSYRLVVRANARRIK